MTRDGRICGVRSVSSSWHVHLGVFWSGSAVSARVHPERPVVRDVSGSRLIETMSEDPFVSAYGITASGGRPSAFRATIGHASSSRDVHRSRAGAGLCTSLAQRWFGALICVESARVIDTREVARLGRSIRRSPIPCDPHLSHARDGTALAPLDTFQRNRPNRNAMNLYARPLAAPPVARPNRRSDDPVREQCPLLRRWANR